MVTSLQRTRQLKKIYNAATIQVTASDWYNFWNEYSEIHEENQSTADSHWHLLVKS